MPAVTFTAETENFTVCRTSSTRDYNFAILAKTTLKPGEGPAWINTVEGVWAWSGDRVNAEKAAQQARKVYRDVRVVPVTAKLTGREATAAKAVEKAAWLALREAAKV